MNTKMEMLYHTTLLGELHNKGLINKQIIVKMELLIEVFRYHVVIMHPFILIKVRKLMICDRKMIVRMKTDLI